MAYESYVFCVSSIRRSVCSSFPKCKVFRYSLHLWVDMAGFVLHYLVDIRHPWSAPIVLPIYTTFQYRVQKISVPERVSYSAVRLRFSIFLQFIPVFFHLLLYPPLIFLYPSAVLHYVSNAAIRLLSAKPMAMVQHTYTAQRNITYLQKHEQKRNDTILNTYCVAYNINHAWIKCLFTLCSRSSCTLICVLFLFQVSRTRFHPLTV